MAVTLAEVGAVASALAVGRAGDAFGRGRVASALAGGGQAAGWTVDVIATDRPEQEARSSLSTTFRAPRARPGPAAAGPSHLAAPGGGLRPIARH